MYNLNDIEGILLKGDIEMIINHPVFYKGKICKSDLMNELRQGWRANCDIKGSWVVNEHNILTFCEKAGFIIITDCKKTYIYA